MTAVGAEAARRIALAAADVSPVIAAVLGVLLDGEQSAASEGAAG